MKKVILSVLMALMLLLGTAAFAQTSTSKPLSITVKPAPPAALVITTESLPQAQETIAYNATLTATGGILPYTWTVTAGSLPAGLTLSSTTGVISGTPTTQGAYDFTVTVRDSNVQGLGTQVRVTNRTEQLK